MAVLDDPTARKRLFELLEAGELTADAARAIGCSRKTVTRYASDHPEFAAAIVQSRMRAKQIAHYGPCIAPRGPDGELAGEHEGAQLPAVRAEHAAATAPARVYDREWYLALLHRLADDDEHQAQKDALRILGSWYLDADITARRRAAEKAVDESTEDDDTVLVVERSASGDRAPGAGRPILDAEIIR